MKRVLSLLLVTCCALTIDAHSQGDKDLKRLCIESGIITSELKGMRTGTEITYFDRYGMREAKYTQAEMMGIKENTLTLLDGPYIYNIDLDTMTGTKTESPVYNALVEAASKDWEEFGKKFMEQMGGEMIAKETLLDKYETEKWKVGQLGTTAWVWEGLTLKSHTNLGGMEMIVIATDVQIGVEVPEEKLTLPKGVTITDRLPVQGMPDIQKMLQEAQEKED